MAKEKKKPKCELCIDHEMKLPMSNLGFVFLILVLLSFTPLSFYLGETFGNETATKTMLIFGMIGTLFGLVAIALPEFKKTVIGKYVYYFKDKDLNVHSHLQMPTWIKEIKAYCWKTPPKNAAEWDAKDFLVDGPIVRVKYGGWFKDALVYYPNEYDATYKSYKCTGDFNRVHPNKRGTFNLRAAHFVDWDKSTTVISGIEMSTALRLIEEFDSSLEIITTALSRRSQVRELNQASQLAETLSQQLFAMLIKIRERRTSMGKSQHARELRNDIEQALMSIPDIFQKLRNWKDFLDTEQYHIATEVIDDLAARYRPEEAETQSEAIFQKKAANS